MTISAPVPPTGQRALLCALVVVCGVAMAQEPTSAQPTTGQAAVIKTVEAPFIVVPIWTSEQTPLDFMEAVGQHTKARWRQLYRQQPPTPSPDRSKTAFILGGLVGDSFLCLQAGDAQTFRNNNQEMLTYCRVLGVADGISPRLMAQAKMAEMDQWTELRQEVLDGQKEMDRILREQHDEDLAILVDLGVWMRILEIVSAIVVENPDTDTRALCIGSPALLEDLRTKFAKMAEATRKEEVVAALGELLDFLDRHWSQVDKEIPSSEVVAKTNERIKALMKKLTLK
ncbi:MAG: hypothetical protein KDK97_08900 [Verrucomicrobiales bacterium]|nr:hypothetical protein [Verrucomicrobiales bacterium]MCP5557729.1 hypothetical protein [Verrucomicrobiaceae bacterium]